MSDQQPAAAQDALQRPSSPMGPLPETDGMQDLRTKMLEIRALALSTEETAKRMHALMTQDYQSRHIIPRKPSTSYGPGATGSLALAALTDEDLRATYHPHDHVQEELDELLGDGLSEPILGCDHYMRNVKIQCFDCQLWFTCRHCHDSSTHLPYPHQLNRKKTQNMLCMICHTAQPAADACHSCGREAAYYYCSKCKLWDNDSTKRIYHCDDCGICRRGEGLGKDFVHCKRCNVCISISTSSSHPCVERATECDCPLCLDYLFSSSTPVVSLLCGHYMHAACYKELMNVTYRCPVCNKSAVNMELQWRKLDDEIRMQPMPEEDFADDEPAAPHPEDPQPADPLDATDSPLAGGLRSLALTNQSNTHRRRVPRKVWVGCNDCGGRGWAAFHWLGLKCPVCDGYNTNQMTPTGSNFRDTPHQSVASSFQRQHDFTGAAILQSFDDPDLAANTLRVPGTAPVAIAHSPARSSNSALSPPSRSYFLSESPSSAHSPRSWASSLSPTRFARRAASGPSTSTSADDEVQPSNADYFALLLARLDRFGISPSEFLSRVGLSPSEFLARLNISPPDFFDRFGISPYDFLARVGRSLSPMRHYLESLDANTRGRAAKAGERMGEVAAAMAEAAAAGGMRWSRRDVAEGMERWEKLWKAEEEDRARARKERGEGDEGEGEQMGFWGADGNFLSGEGEEDAEGHSGEDEEDEEESEEESDSEHESEEGSDAEPDAFELFGHR